MKPSSSLIGQILLLAACWMALLGAVRGQAVTILHSFGDGSVTHDGTIPEAALTHGGDGNYYGTAQNGGSAFQGCVYQMTPQGAVTILHSFGDGSVTHDGAFPNAGLILAQDGNFYGATSGGGSAGQGTVFEITSAGTLTVLHSFGDGSVTHDGSNPSASLIQGLDLNFYGTTNGGGSAGKGSVFQITSAGQVTIIHSFGDGTVANDGAGPQVGLVQDALGNFYGTTYGGGSANEGTAYKIDTLNRLTILHSFSAPTAISFTMSGQFQASGPGGYFPNSRLLLHSNGNLYGTTASSEYGYGAIYQITPQGQETVVHFFGDGTVANDGMEAPPHPFSNQTISGENGLIEGSDQNIYGTTAIGGSAGKGMVFELAPAGQMTILHSFGDGTVPNDGAAPESGVIEDSNGNFYGTTSGGGSAGTGTVFKVIPAWPAITSPLSATGAVGLAFNYQTIATQSPMGYSETGLPDGLTVDPTSGLISGMPLATGTSNVTLTATNGAGSNSVTLVVNIVPVPVITSILSEFGSSGIYFGYRITATGSPSTFNAMGLPTGLSFNAATGVISGTPMETGTFPVTITATNVAGSDSQTLSLVITATSPTYSQEYVQLYSFDGSVSTEGTSPGALIKGNDTTLYGVTAQGGANFSGTIFNVSPAGNESVLNPLGNANGSAPQGLTQGTDGNFYGTTNSGGSAGKGTVFVLTPGGLVNLLHTFGDGTVTNDGANPQGGVIQGNDGNFYGTTQYGGSANLGTIFKITPLGVVTIIHSFGDNSVTNDGANPVAALVLDGTGVMYGTTENGGSQNDGVVFNLYPNGIVTTLHNFGDGSVTNDGQMPLAALTDLGGTFFGTTNIGGSLGKGTVFEITQGGAVTILHNFGDGSVTNDGENPISSVVVNPGPSLGPRIFGTTQNGGTANLGTVFEIDGLTTCTILHNFGDGSVTNDGTTPMAGLCEGSDGNLYGTTVGGGDGYGTVFAIVTNLLPPPPTTFPTSYWVLTGTLPSGMTFDSTTGTVSGTPLSSDTAGAYNFTITFVNAGQNGPPQNIAVNLTQPFSQWAASYSITGPPTDTPFKDGTPNLLKYLCDIDPTTPMSPADCAALPALGMTTSGGAQYLTLTYRQYAAIIGVTVNVQTSPDLQTWTTVSPPDFSQQTGTDPNTGDPIMEVGVLANGSAAQFIRLNVTSP